MFKKYLLVSLVFCVAHADIEPQSLDSEQIKNIQDLLAKQDLSVKNEESPIIKAHVANFDPKKLTPEQLKQLEELSAQSEEVIKIQRRVNEMRLQANVVLDTFVNEEDRAKLNSTIEATLLKMETIFNKDATTEGLMTEGLCINENEASRLRFLQGTLVRICVEHIRMTHYLARYEESLQKFVDSIH